MNVRGHRRQLGRHRLRAAHAGGPAGRTDGGGVERPSLCAGWRVRDVAAHLSMVSLPPAPATMLREGVRARGNFHRLNHDVAVRAAGRPTADIAADLRRHAASRRVPVVTNYRNVLFDVLVHGQDIAIPLEIDRPMPAPAAVAGPSGSGRWAGRSGPSDACAASASSPRTSTGQRVPVTRSGADCRPPPGAHGAPGGAVGAAWPGRRRARGPPRAAAGFRVSERAPRLWPGTPRGGTSLNSPRAGMQQGQVSSSRYAGCPFSSQRAPFARRRLPERGWGRRRRLCPLPVLCRSGACW